MLLLSHTAAALIIYVLNHQIKNVVKSILRSGSLESLKVDFTSPPPNFLYDLLHVAIVQSSGVLSAVGGVLKFCVGRGFGIGGGRRKYGAVM